MKLPFDGQSTSGRHFIDLEPDITWTILRTVEVGWVIALQAPDVKTGAREVALTERLRDGMRQAQNRERSSLSEMLVVLPGTESRSRPDILVPDGLTDIPILCIGIRIRFGDHDPHAIIECKRISGDDANLCRAYVLQGIDRFRTGRYSGNHSTGFMIGYIISGDEQAAVIGINRYLNRNSSPDEILKPSDKIIDSQVWTSRHPRAATSSIKLHHSFLTFTRN